MADDAELLEPVERAVDGGPVGVGVAAVALGHPRHDLVGGDVVIAGHQRLDDRPPRRRDAVAARSQQRKDLVSRTGTAVHLSDGSRFPHGALSLPGGADAGKVRLIAMRRVWAWMALNFGKHAGIVGVIGLAITLVLGLGITKLDFATGPGLVPEQGRAGLQGQRRLPGPLRRPGHGHPVHDGRGPDGRRPVHAREHRPPRSRSRRTCASRGRVRRRQPAHRPRSSPRTWCPARRATSPRASPARRCSAPATASPTRPRRRSASTTRSTTLNRINAVPGRAARSRTPSGSSSCCSTTGARSASRCARSSPTRATPS